MNKVISTFIIRSLLLVFITCEASAVAYCSLRDPVAQMLELYPNKTNQLSIVKTVDADIRAQVQVALPNNDLHFSELGQHTLYVAMDGKSLLGYIHVRSEQSDWGLVEIVWAIATDMTISNFVFQRCRSPKKQLAEQSAFKEIFIGKNYSQLKSLLSNDGTTVNDSVLKQADGASELVNVVLRCALKTLLLTEILWGDDLSKL
jgi:hypothetical protein